MFEVCYSSLSPMGLVLSPVGFTAPQAAKHPLSRHIGTEFTDTVALGGGLTIKAQSIGVASRSTGFDGVDGILG